MELEKQSFRVVTSKAEANSFHHRIGGFYDRMTGWVEAPLRKQGLNLLGTRAGERVLEIGLGSGHSILARVKVVEEDGKIYGVDISEDMIEIAKSKLEHEKLFKEGDLLSIDAITLPYPTGMMDAIFINFTLELFDTLEISKFLAECYRVLRPGGRVVVLGLSGQVYKALSLRLYEWAHRRFLKKIDYRPVFIPQMLREAGFNIERVEPRKRGTIPAEIILARRGASR